MPFVILALLGAGGLVWVVRRGQAAQGSGTPNRSSPPQPPAKHGGGGGIQAPDWTLPPGKPSVSTGYAGKVGCTIANAWFANVAPAACNAVHVPLSMVKPYWDQMNCSQKQQVMILGPVAINTLALQALAGSPLGEALSHTLAPIGQAATDAGRASARIAGQAGKATSKTAQAASAGAAHATAQVTETNTTVGGGHATVGGHKLF